MSRPILEVKNLFKRFSGVVASDHLDLGVDEGEVHAIIGPNGAGKTSLIAQLGGQILPDSGTIRFAGVEVTRFPPHRRSRLGLARSFQITSLFLDLSVLDNVALAVQAHAGHSFRFWGNARKAIELRGPAREVLRRVGLQHRAEEITAALSHGERRLLEVAVALCVNPRMLLLDEPMAGLSPDEMVRMIAMLSDLKRKYTFLVVEHDMGAVFALADRITVLVSGRAVATGTPEMIRCDTQVRDAYLGEEEPAELDKISEGRC